MDKPIWCTSIDSDFKLDKIGKCPSYNEEFVEQMGKQSNYWKARQKLVPFGLKDKELFLSKLTIFDEAHKNSIDSPKESFEQLQKELIEKAEYSLFELVKNDNPGIPDEVIHSFIRMYIGFEMEMTREPKTLSSVVRVIPSWTPIGLIDFDSKEMKLLDEYFME